MGTSVLILTCLSLISLQSYVVLTLVPVFIRERLVLSTMKQIRQRFLRKQAREGKKD